MTNIRSLLVIYLVHLSTLVYGRQVVSVDTNTATYVGQPTSNGTGVVFYGIPYAKPPLGDLRFRAPVPYEPAVSSNGTKQVINATATPNSCIQAAFPPGQGLHGGSGSEDCLHLNVYVPNKALQSNSAKLPVLVYIHGGGFVYGNPLYWPFDDWIEQFPDIVIVSIYYRLSIFGFLAPPSEDGAVDYNAGYLDQVEALKWVKNHISYFGGDSNHITINGQSAGGESILLHLVDSSGPQGLYHQAIAQSVYRPAIPRPSQLTDCFNQVVTQAGCASSNSSVAAKVDCLRQTDIPTLIGIVDANSTPLRICTSSPVIDGTHFKDSPTELLLQHKISAVPILAGGTTDETLSNSTSTVMATELRAWWPFVTDADVNRFNQLYPNSSFGGDEALRVSTASGENLLRCGRETLVTAMTNAGKTAYAYRWNVAPAGYPVVVHSSENFWMFEGTGSGYVFNATESSFASEAIAYWVSFVRSGNPNTYALPGSPQWPKWEGQGKRMVFNEGTTNTAGAYVSGSKVEAEPPAELQRCLTVDVMAPDLQF